MKEYRVKKGQHDFKPNDQAFVTHKNKCDWKFQLTESMWFTREDGEYPYGQYDGWNKLGMGVTWAFSSNSNRSCMVAWFPDETLKNRFTIVGYTNDKKGNWDAEELLNVGIDKVYEGQTIWVGDKVVFKIREEGSQDDYKFLTMPMPRIKWLKLYRGIGAYYGGQYPAFKDMNFFAEIKY